MLPIQIGAVEMLISLLLIVKAYIGVLEEHLGANGIRY
jgi:hypothetical protein